ncbi:membrane cofactor protein-like isoform X3 [Colossoma macropomum]|uniref:membrane cofactor protein-like isoform X3 n=1 Tax=Colossoma macropomum TaxID=42526 RepID=UPI0018641B31|nr:membrane cofactor protein-like isoform X3 [Colossoma macropomum]
MTAKAACRSLIIFLMCLLSVVKIRAQCEKPSTLENRVLTPESIKPTYPDGDTATFQCSVGYKPADPKASKTIICSGNKWDYNTLKLQCTKKSCRPLPDFANGRYTYSPEGDEGVLFGATATAQCNEGYMLLRYTARRCLDAGWDGREPVCEVIKCPSPPEITNGQPEEPLEEYDYGQAVTYVCNAGYTLFGASTVSCSNSGTFEPSPPECIKVSCDSPSVPNGKRMRGIPPFGYRSTVEFACDSGFKMVGSGSLVCDRNGWNPPPPTCSEEMVSCDSPSVPNGKRIKGTPPFGYRSTVEFACDSGFKMVGSGSLVCDRNGWNPPPPTCSEEIQEVSTTTSTTTTATPPTRPTSPAPKDKKEDDNPSPNNAGKIIGGVIGALGVLDLWIILCLIPSLSVLLLS